MNRNTISQLLRVAVAIAMTSISAEHSALRRSTALTILSSMLRKITASSSHETRDSVLISASLLHGGGSTNKASDGDGSDGWEQRLCLSVFGHRTSNSFVVIPSSLSLLVVADLSMHGEEDGEEETTERRKSLRRGVLIVFIVAKDDLSWIFFDDEMFLCFAIYI